MGKWRGIEQHLNCGGGGGSGVVDENGTVDDGTPFSVDSDGVIFPERVMQVRVEVDGDGEGDGETGMERAREECKGCRNHLRR